MNRKEFLQSLGVLAVGTSLLGSEEKLKAASKVGGVDLMTDPEVDFPVKALKASVKDGPVTVVIIGAGNRGRTYAAYAKQFPECMKVIGVSDIRESRKNDMGDKYGIPAGHRFGDWSEVFKVAKFADLVQG